MPADSFNIPQLDADNGANQPLVPNLAQIQAAKMAAQQGIKDITDSSAQTPDAPDMELDKVSTQPGAAGGGDDGTAGSTAASTATVQSAKTGSKPGNTSHSAMQIVKNARQDDSSATQANTQAAIKHYSFPAAAQVKIDSLSKAISASNVPQIVLLVMSLALDLKTSDIHIEPEAEQIRIRYRIDGVLRQVVTYKSNMHSAVVSRIKIMSDLKIDETRIPQDGRTSVQTTDGREMDLRVSTLPTVNGEKIVMRLQDKSKQIPSLKMLGVQGNGLKAITRALGKPNGVILVSGPTGSGKTTTLYAALSILNKVGVNILTIEDPVEIQLNGLNQSQVKADIGFDFARGLRAALRQDPDIIMVGEIRDHETIDVAIEAALTGHLVFSTIHTNSSIETITRIANMEVPEYLIASAVDTIIAQRLVRKINPDKAERYTPEPKILEAVKKTIAEIPGSEKKNYPDLDFENPSFVRPKAEFGETAFSGRLGVYEVLSMSGELKDALLHNANVLELQKIAQKNGMVTLEQYGLIMAMQGLTSLDEVYRVANTD